MGWCRGSGARVLRVVSAAMATAIIIPFAGPIATNQTLCPFLQSVHVDTLSPLARDAHAVMLSPSSSYG
jgi:hypothetical protein